METFETILAVVIVGALVYVKLHYTSNSSVGTSNIICPHCQTKGKVHTKLVKRKRGISGGKVMGGLFTLGTSLLVTGLSRKEQATQAHCANCDSTWDF